MKKGKTAFNPLGLWRKFKNLFCIVFLDRKNLGRDVAITILTIVFLGGFLIVDVKNREAEKKEKIFQTQIAALSEEEIYHEVSLIQEGIDITNWKTYQSKWYGFEVKYPENLNVPKSQAAVRGSKWEYRFQFREKDPADESPYAGFDIAVYNLSKTKELSDIGEFPPTKNVELKEKGKCESIEGHIIETGDYPAEEVYIPPVDDCYESALFFYFIKGDYIYVLDTALKEGFDMQGDPRVEIVDNFPEFFSVASALKPIDIMRSKSNLVASKMNAPHPVSFKKKGGRLVCAKKDDKPSKSKQKKGKHLDMECCLDPDEYPNPHCYYSPEKYSKLLK